MMRNAILLLGLTVCVSICSPTAVAGAVASSAAEDAFVKNVAGRLQAEFPSVARARARGYTQLRKIDKDNTIVYTNFAFDHISIDHPNFLWFDRRGNLVGVDYEFPKERWRSPPGTSTFPVSPSRWTTVDEHVHLAYRETPSGPVKFKGGPATAEMRGATLPADVLVRAHLLPPDAHLVWSSYHPACWDLGFWIVPNPLGPFEDHNPSVK